MMEITMFFLNWLLLSQLIMVVKAPPTPTRVPPPDSSDLRTREGSFTSWKVLSSQLWCSFKVPRGGWGLNIGWYSKAQRWSVGEV